MPGHKVAETTRSLEMAQIQQINQQLATDRARPRAQDLGVAGVTIRPGQVDTIAARRAHLPAHLSFVALTVDEVASDSRLVELVAAGSPTFPYIYGLFAGGGADTTNAVRSDASMLPVTLHTAQLRTISARYRFHHHWGS
jgi:hypothetical protein